MQEITFGILLDLRKSIRKNMAKILQLNIRLEHIAPKIWRRVLVPDSITFKGLHEIIQNAMGWGNCHLWQFKNGRNNYIGLAELLEDDVQDAGKLKLSAIFNKIKAKVSYEYDFGDGWDHIILLEKILEPDKKLVYPVCIDGARNCPPEDCGGVWGYSQLVETMADKKHPEYKDMKEWLGYIYKPEKFDLKEANHRLRNL